MRIGQETRLEIEGTTYTVQVKSIQGDQAQVIVDGRELSVTIQGEVIAPAPVQQPKPAAPASAAKPTASPTPSPATTPPTGGANAMTANMPGVVVKLLVKPDQEVKAGEVVMVLEAMKMENELRASQAGTVATIHVQTGQRVQTGDPLLSWK